MNLLRINQLCKKLSVSRPTLYRIMNSDQSFPKPIALTPSINVFNEMEIDNWIELKSTRKNEN
ncbi:helix-turn-helix transcriptional regulator [Cellvibrio sp. QJXJ]|uniref:helix-turn-helix transcriptional regulator n=1 Tax=Cellvibrio sp. QJXJ TaxID=2964606 RepID=UPI0039659575